MNSEAYAAMQPLYGLGALTENNAMKRVSVCVAKRIPALHFLAASQFVSLSRFGFPFLSTYFCGFTFEIPTCYNIQAFQSVEHAIECNKRC